MMNKYKKNGKYGCNGGCPLSTYQDMDVSVPVSVRAYADVGNVKVECIGSTIVPVQEGAYCSPCGTNKFIISQRIRVDIPIICGAEADVDKEQVYYDIPKPYYSTPKENNTYNL